MESKCARNEDNHGSTAFTTRASVGHRQFASRGRLALPIGPGESIEASLGQVARGVWPLLALMLVTVAVLYIFPDLVLYIPFKW